MGMIESETLRLRAVEQEDLERLMAWENNMELMRFGEAHLPYSRDLMQRYIEQASDDLYIAKQFRFMMEIRSTRETIGHIDLHDFDPQHLRASVGILIAQQQHRKQGWALEALDLLEEYAYEAWGVFQLYAHIPLSNQASQALFQKAGFVKTGQLKYWLRKGKNYEDVTIWQKGIEP